MTALWLLVLPVLAADGDRCDRCPHASNLTPEPGQVPEAFPLVSGQVVCTSCHEAPTCDDASTRAPDFVRGGPYPRLGTFCASCHPTSATEPFDPHAAMTQNARDAHVCELCHQTAPDRAAQDVDLKVSGSDICIGCHTESRHAGMSQHRGAVPPEMVGRAEAAGLPLDRGVIVCLTCHDPHPPGATATADARASFVDTSILPQAWLDAVWKPALATRSEKLGVALEPIVAEPLLVRLPLEGGALCMACHETPTRAGGP